MTAFGRLWRRAPLWRACLLTTAAMAGLAVMFPPAMPDWTALRWRVAPLHGSAARFHPQPVPVAHDNEGMLHMLPPGPLRSGQVSFAGRPVPLPAGKWGELAVGRSQDREQHQLMLLDRIVGDRLTGLMLIASPGVLGEAAGLVGIPAPCMDGNRVAGAIVPAQPGDSPLAHECWATVPVDMQATDAHTSNNLIRHGLAELGEMHVSVADHMLATTFVRSVDSGWQIVTVMMPDTGGPVTRVRDWAGRFLVLLHKGFDRTLSASDLAAAAIRDPV